MFSQLTPALNGNLNLERPCNIVQKMQETLTFATKKYRHFMAKILPIQCIQSNN